VKLVALGAALVLAACGGAGDHEQTGDLAYGEGRFADALAEYRSVLGRKADARLWAKAAAAALHAGDLRQAAGGYLRLAGDDPTRTREAAEGLESVARAAERAGNAGALRDAVVGLEAIAPDQVMGRYAILLAREAGSDKAALVAVLPSAIASATESGVVDSLLTVYGAALKESAGCSQALLPFRTVLRRSPDSLVAARARAGVAECALALGQRAQGAGNVRDAALWFAESARMDSTSVTGRRALLGYGEARAQEGDTLAAVLAFRAAANVSSPDSVSQAAAARLAALEFRPAPGAQPLTEGR
jgi:tetratricopeptide (TPR) repeat protein